MTIRTRFAPSPTGNLHIGGVRTALFSYLYARRFGGQFVLRIEDTDRARSTDEAVEIILDGMRWLGLAEDEGPFFQSRRTERYVEVIDQLLASGHAYRCYCTPEELNTWREQQRAAKKDMRNEGHWRQFTEPREGIEPVVRFKMDLAGTVVFDDAVQGRVAVNNAELDDLIIARSDGSPTYNLTVVVDDLDMRISHVIRGDDHLSNTPKQINIMRALGAEPPVYAHVPMILGPDGAKLSKRHGAVSVLEYREQGVLPQALLNYLVRLGWSHGDQEVFSMAQMVELFDIAEVNKSASALNPDKLAWLNQHYLRETPPEALADALREQLIALNVAPDAGPSLAAVVGLYSERATDLASMAQSSRWLFEELNGYAEKASRKFFKPESGPVLATMHRLLSALPDWEEAAIDAAIKACMAEHELKMGAVAQPLRVAVTGDSVSPSVGATLVVAGRDTSLARIERAIAWIEAQHA